MWLNHTHTRTHPHTHTSIRVPWTSIHCSQHAPSHPQTAHPSHILVYHKSVHPISARLDHISHGYRVYVCVCMYVWTTTTATTNLYIITHLSLPEMCESCSKLVMCYVLCVCVAYMTYDASHIMFDWIFIRRVKGKSLSRAGESNGIHIIMMYECVRARSVTRRAEKSAKVTILIFLYLSNMCVVHKTPDARVKSKYLSTNAKWMDVCLKGVGFNMYIVLAVLHTVVW